MSDQEIVVSVESCYLEALSSTDMESFVFAYTVTIHNHSTEEVQLLSRHWVVTNADNETVEIKGDGVVGEQPLIGGGKSHSYSSFVILKTPVGSMHGSYQMQGSEGFLFDVPIKPFSLNIPELVH